MQEEEEIPRFFRSVESDTMSPLMFVGLCNRGKKGSSPLDVAKEGSLWIQRYLHTLKQLNATGIIHEPLENFIFHPKA